MPNAHDIAAEINSYFEGNSSQSKAYLANLAESYASLLVETNKRLKRCAEFLRRGLRTEAIYHAEISPSLLDQAYALDIPRSENWRKFCNANELKIPPELLHNTIAMLNQAYADQEPVKELLRHIRLLAVARAPIKSRIGALRLLLEKEASNNQLIPQLEKDIEDFEELRLNEIEKEAQSAAEAENVSMLENLISEFTSEQWRLPRASAVHAKLMEQQRNIDVELGLRELRKLLPEIHSARMANSFDDCKSLLLQWNEIIQTKQLSLPDDLAGEIITYSSWVDDIEATRSLEREFRNACAALDNYLYEDKLSTRQLNKFYQEAISFDKALPEELEHRYLSAKREAEHREGIKLKLIVAGAAVVVLLFVAGAIFLVRYTIQEREARAWAASINQKIDSGKLDVAARLLDVPEMANRPELPVLCARLDSSQKVVKDRKTRYKTCLRSIQTSMGVKTPGMVRSSTVKSLSEAKKFVKEAKGFAVSSNEKLTLINWETAIQKVSNARQSKIDEAFTAKTKELRGKIEKLAANRTLLQRDLDKYGLTLGKLESNFFNLKNLAGVTPDVKNSVISPMKRKLNVLNERVRRERAYKNKQAVREVAEKAKRRMEADAIAELVDSSGSATGLKDALAKFIQKFPNHAKSADFKKTSALTPLWGAVQQYDTLIQDWNDDLNPRTKKSLLRQKKITKYLKKYPGCPDRQMLLDYKSYLEKAQAAVGSESPWKTSLPQSLQSPTLHLYCFKCPDGSMYYMKKKEKISTNSMGLSVTVVLSSKLDKQRTIIFKRITLSDLQKKPELSPQGKLANQLIEKLDDYDSSRWNSMTFDIAETIRKDENVDPIIRIMLLRMVLVNLQDFSWGCDDEIKMAMDETTKWELDGVNWINPSNEEANRLRPRIAKSLKKIQSFTKMKMLAKKKLKGLFKRLATPNISYGIAIRNKGKWRIAGRPGSLLDGRTVWVIGNKPDGSDNSWRKIAVIREGKAVIDKSATSELLEGTMVFIRENK